MSHKVSFKEEDKVVYITSYLELDRKNWKTYPRTFEEYLEEFLPFITYMSYNIQHMLYVFIDDRHIDKLKSLVNISNIFIFGLNYEKLLDNNKIWKLLPRERKIMESEQFKNMVSGRANCPETYIPEYTLVNHFKTEVIKMGIEINNIECGYLSSNNRYYVWMDFGWFKKGYHSQGINPMPQAEIDIERIDKDRVNYTLLKPLDENDFSADYTIKIAPEKVVGGFFVAREDKMLEYIDLYYKELLKFQDLALADDDQHILIRCVKEKPELFKLHVLGCWCAGPIYFQKFYNK